MEFIAQKEQTIEQLQTVMGVVGRKPTFPILAHVLLTITETTLFLLGTDLEIELITESTPLAIKIPGMTTIPAKKWLDILRTLPDRSAVQYRLEANKLRIEAENARFSISTLPAPDFPRMSDAGETTKPLEWMISEAILLALFKKTAFSMAEQDVRHYLNGLFLELNSKKIKAVAADGHRLAMAEESVLHHAESNMQIILPRRAVLELMRLLQDTHQPILVQVGSNYFRIKTQSLKFTCVLIDSKFPFYQSLIPKTALKILQLEREPFKQAVQRVTTLSHEQDHPVLFKLSPQCITMCSKNPLYEEAEVVLATPYMGEDFEVAFNGHYMLDILNAIETPMVELSLPAPKQSIRVQAPEQTENLYVVMPVFL